MGQYKVPSDVSSEDKLIGNLSIRQFAFAVVGVLWAFLWLRAGLILFFAIGLLPSITLMALAFGQWQGRPFERFLIALIEYQSMSKERIWMKDPEHDIFKAEEKKKEVEELQLVSPEQVEGQLDELALIVDTRGWQSGNQTVQIEPGLNKQVNLENRVLSPGHYQPAAFNAGQPLVEDVSDMFSQEKTLKIDSILSDSSQQIVQDAKQRMTTPAKLNDRVDPELAKKLPDAHIHSLRTDSPLFRIPKTVIMKIATSNDDLTVEALSQQANNVVLKEGQAVSLQANGNRQTGSA